MKTPISIPEQRMRAELAVEMAKARVGTSDSAALCLSDAQQLLYKAHYEDAHRRAMDSLAHSVGIFSPIYQACK